jgi:hypothetical protein
MENLDGPRCVLRRRHLHEREAAWLPGDSVRDDRNVFDVTAVGREQRPELLRVTAVRKVPDVDLRRHIASPALEISRVRP